jgi:4-amino-4-deoxy-L-arabinose transferase-like glycosyltransferase
VNSPALRRNHLIILFLLSLSLRWAYALRFPAQALLADVDARGYHLMALNLLQGHGFTLNSEPPYIADTLRTPAYPAFVAAVYATFGPEPRAVALTQGVLDSATALVLTALTLRLTQSARAALAAGVVYALNPTAWRFSDAVLTEIPLGLVITASMLICLHVRDLDASRPASRRTSFALGLLGGLAALIRPNMFILPLGLAAGLRRRQRAWLEHASAILVGAALVVIPWVIRNWIVAGRPQFSSVFDENLSRVSAVGTLAQAQGEAVAPWTPRWEEIYSGLVLQAAERYAWPDTPPRSVREVEARRGQLAAVAREVIAQHPQAFILSHLAGFGRAWIPQEHRFWYEFLSGQSWAELQTAEGAAGQALNVLRHEGLAAALRFLWQERVAKLPPLALALWYGWLLAYLMSAVLLGLGTWRLRGDPGLLWLVWGTVFYVTFLPGPISAVRFRVPVAPLLIAVMAVGAQRLFFVMRRIRAPWPSV